MRRGSVLVKSVGRIEMARAIGAGLFFHEHLPDDRKQAVLRVEYVHGGEPLPRCLADFRRRELSGKGRWHMTSEGWQSRRHSEPSFFFEYKFLQFFVFVDK